MTVEKKKRILSGIQPSGVSFTLGNYVGAVRNWQALQDEYDCFYMIANMHAITLRQVPAQLRQRTKETAALLLACGISPEKSVVFVQSDVAAHTQLNWVFNCLTPFGELTRMHQFKEKSAKNVADINSGLFTYPVLMAADILLYNPDLVPVGIDQKQHLELARNTAQRFNSMYSETFIVPDGYIPKTGAKIMSLQEPDKKMSKSDENAQSYILMLDDEDTIVRKLKRAVTDSDGKVCASDDKPGITNLITIYSAMTGKTFEEIENDFANLGYGDFKMAVAQSIVEKLVPIQNEYKKILEDKTYLDDVLKKGNETANYISSRIMSKIYRKVGFL